MNYTKKTRERIRDVVGGIFVKTSTIAAATYLAQSQQEMFDMGGSIWIRQLYLEVATTAFGAQACQILFNTTFTTPVIAVNAMCGKCASVSGLGVGSRVVWLGGAVATAAVITDSAGLSDVIASSGQIVGGEDFVGTIGVLSSDASLTSGKFFAGILYVPLTDGSYVSAKR